MKRVGSVVYSTEQGLGHLAKDFYKEGVINDVLIFQHTSRTNNYHWYERPDGSLPHIITNRPFFRHHKNVCQQFLDKVDVVLFFETPFDWDFMKQCRLAKKKVVLMMMYEWFPLNPPVLPDLILCPSKLDADYAKQSGFEHKYIPVPVPREVSSLYRPRERANRFLYSGGNMGCRHDSRGAKTVLESLDFIDPEIQITYRVQDSKGFSLLDINGVHLSKKYPNVNFEIGGVPYLEQWEDHDVLIAPEKYNGLSLPLQEAKAVGMYVITTNRYPTNTWIDFPLGFNPVGISRGNVGGAYNEIDICEVSPLEVAYTVNELYKNHNSIEEDTRRSASWLDSMSWDYLKPEYLKALN